MSKIKKKETLSERVEVRLSRTSKNKLVTRARLYFDGDVSELIRYWIENADIPLKERKKDESD